MMENGISELHRRDSWRFGITRSPPASIDITYVPETPPHTRRTPTDDRHVLRRMMAQAVLEENYELACILRDRISSPT